MKRILVLAIFVALANIASAATITVSCTVFFSPVEAASGNVTCPDSFSGANALPVGETVISFAMNYTLDYTTTTEVGALVNFTFNPPGTGFDDDWPVAVSTPRPVNGSNAGLTSEVSLYTAPFTVPISWTATVPPITGVTAQLSFTVITEPDTPGIPEPSTFALLGLGLVGTALVARRPRS